MENRSVTFGLTGIGVIAAIVALGLRGAPGVAAPPVVAPAQASVASPKPWPKYTSDENALSSFHQGRRLLAEYLGEPRARACRVLASPSTGRTAKQSPVQPGDGACPSLAVMVATIPDPFDSHLDWSYDADIEALRRAFGSAGFVPQSFWLPGRDDSLRVVVGRDTTTYPAPELHPGVFLFRSIGSQEVPALRLLYLVPEVPTSGVRLKAFRAAITEREAVLAAGFHVAAGERAELSVLGPRFSGSSRSLRTAIDAAIAPAIEPRGNRPATARIISGSATRYGNLATLSDTQSVVVPSAPDNQSNRESNKKDTRNTLVKRIRFSATVNPDEAMDALLDDIVKRLNVDPGRVAVLSESGTQYGVAQRDSAGTGGSSPPQPAQCGDSPSDRTRTGNSRSQSPPYLSILFPINIASLRSEFERSPNRLEASPNLPAFSDAPRTRLSLEVAGRARELPQVMSSLTVPALDAVLSTLIGTLNEHRIRVVVIKATDVRDKLMLAREIAAGVRDAVIVLYENNVLLRRAEYTQALRGALVLSTYPLTLENQFWSTAHRDSAGVARTPLDELFVFSNEAAVGAYNAAVSLLGHPGKRVEYSLHNAFSNDSTLRGASTKDSSYLLPPVWLTVIGRGNSYPVRAMVPAACWQQYLEPSVPPTSSSSSTGREHNHSYERDHAGFWLIVIAPAVLVLVLAGMFAVGREGARRGGVRYSPAMERPASARQGVFLSLFLLSLVATYLPFSVAVDARRIIGSIDPLATGWSVEMMVVLVISGVVVLASSCTLAMAVWGTMRWSGSVKTKPQQDDAGKKPAPGASLTSAFREAFTPLLHVARHTQGVGLVRNDSQSLPLDLELTRREHPFVARVGIAVITLTSLLFIATSLVYTAHLLSFSGSGGIEGVLSVYRALHLTSGVSPIAPLVLLGSTFSIWTWWQLQQTRLFDRPDEFENGMRQLAMENTSPANWRRAYRAVVDARRGLSWILPGGGVVWIVLVFIVVIWFGANRHLASLEVIADPTEMPSDYAFDIALWVGIVALATASAWAIYRLMHTWHGLERFLDIVAGTPIACAIARLPLDVARLTDVGFLGFRRDSCSDESYRNELWKRAIADAGLANGRSDGSPGASSILATGQGKPSDADASSQANPGADTWMNARIAEQLHKLAANSARTAAAIQTTLDSLHHAWEAARTRPHASEDLPIEAPTVNHTNVRALRSLEEYMAFEVLLYVEMYLLNLRRLCFFLFASLLILVVVSGQYPFVPDSIIALVAIALLISTIVAIFFVMLRMSRNATLSRVARTEPGKVTWDTTLVLNAVIFGVVPLIALASAEFPEVRSFLFSWAEPLVRAVARS